MSMMHHDKSALLAVWQHILPALILASISTRESAGIHSAGSSTRSRIGMLGRFCQCMIRGGETPSRTA